LPKLANDPLFSMKPATDIDVLLQLAADELLSRPEVLLQLQFAELLLTEPLPKRGLKSFSVSVSVLPGKSKT